MAVAKSTGRGKVLADRGTRGGFTIIEVVLVLAIAGLIFLMVFIALPALRRSQRDTQRQNSLGAVADAIQDYQTNNNGRLPADGKQAPVEANGDGVVPMDEYNCSNNSACNLIKNYLNGANAEFNEFVDPQFGGGYGLEIADISAYTGSLDYDYVIHVYKHARCDGETAVKTNNARDYVIMMRSEGSGTFCRN